MMLLKCLTNLLPTDSVAFIVIQIEELQNAQRFKEQEPKQKKQKIESQAWLKSLVEEYIEQAKTKLKEMGEGLSQFNSTPRSSVASIVQSALKHFERKDTIGESTMSAWIFNKSWYLSDFIPALIQMLVEADHTYSSFTIPLNAYISTKQQKHR